MKEVPSFHDILDAKLHTLADFPSEKWTEDSISGVEPKHLSTIFALMSDKILSGPKPTIPKAYQQRPRTALGEKRVLPLVVKENRTKEPQKKAVKPRVPGPKHQLSREQKLSFDFFGQSGKSLLADFNREELQLAYRQLALQFHPDRQSGSSKHFIDLKFHYEVLKKLFK